MQPGLGFEPATAMQNAQSAMSGRLRPACGNTERTSTSFCTMLGQNAEHVCTAAVTMAIVNLAFFRLCFM